MRPRSARSRRTRKRGSHSPACHASGGSYLHPDASPTLASGRRLDDYREIVLGQDIGFAWHNWQAWAEFYGARFEIPTVGNAHTFAYYVEAKYKFTPQLSGALRWNQQLFNRIGDKRWGRDIWRIDTHAFLFTDGTGMADLGTLGGYVSTAFALDGAGNVVGTAENASAAMRAFLWTQASAAMRDLNDCIPVNSGWVLTEARGVNDAGQIVGNGLHNGQPRAFLLTPNSGPDAAPPTSRRSMRASSFFQ